MAPFRIEFKPSVEKDLRGLTKPLVARVLERVQRLAEDPMPREAVKLAGAERLYRLRVGAYRVVYEIDTAGKLVLIHYVRHRREAYRRR